MENHVNLQLDAEIIQVITTQQAWHYRIIPVQKTSASITFITDHQNAIGELIPELEILLGKKIETEFAEGAIIQSALSKFYRKAGVIGTEGVKRKNILLNHSGDFLSTLIEEAHSLNSSDIHIESYEDKCRIRIRIDGKLIERYIIPRNEYPALINKIKIKANLDISEKRLPQDGRILFKGNNLQFDIRVSALPTLYGEKIVLRLLGNDASKINIRELGFFEHDLTNFLKGINRLSGIVLISGPTGSGKTTTLYAALRELNKESRNILTVEDPIEYTLEGINQVQLKESIGLTFASTLRTFLRQDPDIIMLGEIRDAETAQMAIRAALTGHLVLSTIHTNSAIGIISRLVDMGLASYLVASTLNTAVAQRLIRLLCPTCKQEIKDHSSTSHDDINASSVLKKHFKSVGCAECYYTGYRGRRAIYEVIPIDGEIAELIRLGQLKPEHIEKLNSKSSLKKSALQLFHDGETSHDEISDFITTYQ